MKKIIFSGWNFMRALRAVLGAVILYQSILAHDAIYGFAGAVFMFTGIFNIGCCGAGNCSASNINETKIGQSSEVTFEEIK